jgi:DNA-binding MarR family transcriptional regulator
MNHPFARLPGYALRRAANTMMDILSARLEPIGLKVTDASVLLLIDGRKDTTSSEIGRILDIQRANMVPLLNRLEERTLIRRDPLDRKSMAIVLTEAGEAYLKQVKDIIELFEKELLERIPEQHRNHLIPALNALWT